MSSRYIQQVLAEAEVLNAPGHTGIGALGARIIFRTDDGIIKELRPALPTEGDLIPTFPLVATTVSSAIFIADRAYEVVSVREAHAVASTSGTLQVQKLTGTTAPGSGIDLLTGAVDLAAVANTPQSGTLIATQASKRLAAGDRLGITIAGTMTNLAGGILTVGLKRV